MREKLLLALNTISCEMRSELVRHSGWTVCKERLEGARELNRMAGAKGQ